MRIDSPRGGVFPGRRAIAALMGCMAAAAIVSLAGAAGLPPAPAGESRFDLYVLGVAQDGGLPHVGCTRDCCAAARRTGEKLYPVSLGVHDRESSALLLVEASPAVEPQLALLYQLSGGKERPRGRPVDAVLLTHAHIGHYLGLAQFGREVASTRALPVHGSARMAAFLRGNGPWSQMVELDQIVLHIEKAGEDFEPIPGLAVTPLAVPHRDEFSDTFAYRLRGPAATVLFVPDIDRWNREPGLLERLLDGIDVAYLDATFYDGRELPGRSLEEIPHPPMINTMERLGALAAERPGAIRFIHFNHTNPVLHDDALREEVEARGFGLAKRGERLGL